jgi:hypothetical protein
MKSILPYLCIFLLAFILAGCLPASMPRETESERITRLTRDPRDEELNKFLTCVANYTKSLREAAEKKEHEKISGLIVGAEECKKPRSMRENETIGDYIDRLFDEGNLRLCNYRAVRDARSAAERIFLENQCDQTFQLQRIRRAAERQN